MKIASSYRQRNAFTLVELLVAVALTIAIMGMIGFVMGRTVDTFRNLNAVANMQTKLVTAQTVMKRDLAAEHFGGNFNPAFSGPYVADQRLDLPGWRPPEEGFFSIHHGNLGGNAGLVDLAGKDSDGLWSSYAVDHTLHFSVRLSGKREEDYFYALAPFAAWNLTSPDFRRPAVFNPIANVNSMASEWGEVFYYLVGNGANANGQPLFTLYRRQRAILPAGTATPVWNAVLRNTFPDVCCNQAANGLTTSDTIGLRTNRLQVIGPAPGWRTFTYAESFPLGVNDPRAGNDILMTDVISFEVRVLWSNGAASLPAETMPPIASPLNPADLIFAVLPPSPIVPGLGVPRNAAYGVTHRAFDTWSAAEAAPTVNWDDSSNVGTGFNNPALNPPPLRIRVQTLQIRIRVWDFNTNQSRQVCFVQDI